MTEDNQKRNTIALVVSGALVGLVIIAWLAISVIGIGDSSTNSEDLAGEQEASPEISVDAPPFDQEAFAKIKSEAQSGYEEIKQSLSGSADYDKELGMAVGNMDGGLSNGKTAEEAGDLPKALSEYKAVINQVDYFHLLKVVVAKRNEPKLKNANAWSKIETPFSKQDSKTLRSLFLDAEETIAGADKAFRAYDFQLAMEQLEQADQNLDTVSKATDDVVAKYWALSEKGIDAGDRDQAEAAIFVVASIDPAYSGLESARQRASTIHIVRPKEIRAIEFEETEMFHMAKSLYDEILQTDPLSTIAQGGAVRMDAALKQKAIETTGLALSNAVTQEEWKKAKGLLADLRALDSSDPRIENFGTQISRGLNKAKIATLKAEGLLAEKAFDWNIAAEKYESILLINNSLNDIREAYERANTGKGYQEAALDAMLRSERHAELDTSESLAKALYLLAEARKRYGLKADMLANIDILQSRFEDRLGELEAPVAIKLVSDGSTKVNFWKVGRFEPFTEKELSLEPGEYTVQGLRSGYVEKYMKVVVRPVEKNQVIEIICDEKS